MTYSGNGLRLHDHECVHRHPLNYVRASHTAVYYALWDTRSAVHLLREEVTHTRPVADVLWFHWLPRVESVGYDIVLYVMYGWCACRLHEVYGRVAVCLELLLVETHEACGMQIHIALPRA